MRDIKLLVLNVDGVLTDGGIAYGGGHKIKSFSVKDSLILKALPHVGISVVLFMGFASEAVRQYAVELSSELIENTADKQSVLERILTERGLTFADVAYIGNDLNNFAVMKRCGFKACPTDVDVKVKMLADYISPYPGGHGAVYDVCEKLPQASDLHDVCEKLLQASAMEESFLRLFNAL
ncbi:MAG: hypothetical protein LBF60_03555 [Treponema sp.]|jgi:3-deoxy-D-manno-octulosonate 8-phosphate phosphatase (KDO 8-P phosphatase)|nr:hypothetical protein [Treponema sp.]